MLPKAATAAHPAAKGKVELTANCGTLVAIERGGGYFDTSVDLTPALCRCSKPPNYADPNASVSPDMGADASSGPAYGSKQPFRGGGV